MTEKKEVALKKETPIANAELDAMLMEDAGAGTEFMNKDDFAIPRISILQSGSDQVKKSSGGYIQGAEEGMFFDNISNEKDNTITFLLGFRLIKSVSNIFANEDLPDPEAPTIV